MCIDDPVTIKCFSSHLPVRLFPSAKFISYGAPVIGVPNFAKEAIYQPKVVPASETGFKKAGEGWIVQAVCRSECGVELIQEVLNVESSAGSVSKARCYHRHFTGEHSLQWNDDRRFCNACLSEGGDGDFRKKGVLKTC